MGGSRGGGGGGGGGFGAGMGMVGNMGGGQHFSGLPDGEWQAKYKPMQMGPQAQAWQMAQQQRQQAGGQGNDMRTAPGGQPGYGVLQGLAGDRADWAGRLAGGATDLWKQAQDKLALARAGNPAASGAAIPTYDQATARFADYNPTGPQVNSQVGYSGAYGVPGWNNGAMQSSAEAAFGPKGPMTIPGTGGPMPTQFRPLWAGGMGGRPMYGGPFGSPGGIGPGGIYNIMQALAGDRRNAIPPPGAAF